MVSEPRHGILFGRAGVFLSQRIRHGADSAMALDGEGLSRMPGFALEKRISEVFVALREPVYRYLQSVLRSDADAEDITQEAFIRLLKEVRRGRSVDNVRAWVFRVAHNLAVDQVRKPQSRADCVCLDDPISQDLCQRDPGPEESVVDSEKRNQVRRALHFLTPEERQCVELRAVGLRYREIAEILDTQIPNIQALLVRAITKIGRNVRV